MYVSNVFLKYYFYKLGDLVIKEVITRVSQKYEHAINIKMKMNKCSQKLFPEFLARKLLLTRDLCLELVNKRNLCGKTLQNV